MKIVDLHCDTVAKIYKTENTKLRCNSFSVDAEKLKVGGSLAQFFALFVDQGKEPDPLWTAKQMMELFYKEMEDNANVLRPAANMADLCQNSREGKGSAFLTIEEGGVIQGKLENLRMFYEAGVRLMTLTWNYPNEIGYPNYHYTYKDCGLTAFGRECVEAMNEWGMIADVSHLSDQGFFDVSEISKKPFVASHSNARAVFAHSRNLTDGMIKVLAECGGVMGINFAAHFLGEGCLGKIDDMVRHIRHIYNVGGIGVISLGTDFDGIDTPVEIRDFSQMQKLFDALEKDGFTFAEIEKIASQNALRVMKDCLGESLSFPGK